MLAREASRVILLAMFTWLHAKRKFGRLLGLSLALLTLLFLAQVTLHAHTSGQGELTCQICHAAQGSRIQLAAGASWTALSTIARFVPRTKTQPAPQLFAREAQSRAPPFQT